MAQKKEIYKCEICGNIVEVLHEGTGQLVCCGQDMKLISENTVEASTEKHIPVIDPLRDDSDEPKNEQGVIIKIGSKAHPMNAEHFIEWIEISTEKGESKKFLKPGDTPEAKFPVKVENIKARAYCNLHGLWKGE